MRLVLALLVTVTLGFTVHAEDQSDSIRYGGRSRKYLVHFADRFKGKKLPVVIALHGGGGTAEGMVNMSRLNSVADEEGFMVVYPQGVGLWLTPNRFGTWNAGLCCGRALDLKIDDVGFISALIDQLSKEYSIDTKRVYATGISNGAMLSYRLACELSNKIAAVAPVAGQGLVCKNKPGRAVPILHIHGTNDPCALYDGGSCGGCFNRFFSALGLKSEEKKFPCPNVDDYIGTWRELNDCCGSPQQFSISKSTECEVSSRCNDNSEVTLCVVHGGGHTWPGGTWGVPSCLEKPSGKVCKIWKECVGALVSDYDASKEMWAFFKRHSL